MMPNHFSELTAGGGDHQCQNRGVLMATGQLCTQGVQENQISQVNASQGVRG